MDFKPVDIIIIGIVVLFAGKGLWRGFFRESLGLVAIAAGAFCVLFFGDALAALGVEKFSASLDIARVGAYAVCFLVPFVTIKLAAHFLQKATKAIMLGPVDRVAGFFFGAVVGMIAVGGVLAALDSFGYGAQYVADSVVADPLREIFSRVMDTAARYWSVDIIKVSR